MEPLQDLFICHTQSDKDQFITPLAQALTARGITFWLDSMQITWGDAIAAKINQGLRSSRFVLVCLSPTFLGRPWPENEMNAALAIQNDHGEKKVLPLILADRDEVLRRYPLLQGLAYREFSVGPDAIADELSRIVGRHEVPEGFLHVIVESVHTGQVSNIVVSPRVSVHWLAEKAKLGAGLKDTAETGAFAPFRIRWVLVDAQAEDEWARMPRRSKRRIHALIRSTDGVSVSRDGTDRLEALGVYGGIVFHLYAIEDEGHDPPSYRMVSPVRRGGGAA
jgi:hypothetical protein